MPDEVTPDYIRARWAYSELISPSFGRFYAGPGITELKEKARRNVAFGTLTVDEGNLLAHQFSRVRGHYFNPYLAGIQIFRLVQWTKDDLGEIAVIPYFLSELGLPATLGMTFKDWIEAAPAKPPAKDHPRCARHDTGAHSFSSDPVTAGCWSGFSLPILLDGYHVPSGSGAQTLLPLSLRLMCLLEEVRTTISIRANRGPFRREAVPMGQRSALRHLAARGRSVSVRACRIVAHSLAVGCWFFTAISSIVETLF